jgi:hypothetical protein
LDGDPPALAAGGFFIGLEERRAAGSCVLRLVGNFLIFAASRAVAAQIQFWKIIRRLNVAIEVPMNAADIGSIAAKPTKPTAT